VLFLVEDLVDVSDTCETGDGCLVNVLSDMLAPNCTLLPSQNIPECGSKCA